MKKKPIVSGVLILMLTALSAQGATLFHYAANNTTEANRAVNSSPDSGNWTTSMSTTGFRTDAGWSAPPYIYFRAYNNVVPNTATPQYNGASYLQFTVTATNSSTVDLTTLTFNLSTRFDVSGTAYARAWISTDNGTSFTAAGSVLSKSEGVSSVPTAPTAGSVDLSSYTGLQHAIIRISLGDTINTSPSSAFLGDIKLTGVPEPTATLLGGIGMLLLLRRRRN